MTPTDIEKLKELASKATPGPWDVWSEPCESVQDAERELCEQAQKSEPFAYAVYLLNAGGKCPATTGCGPTSKANADYLAAANPAVVLSLIAALEAAHARIKQYEARLEIDHYFVLDPKAADGLRRVDAPMEFPDGIECRDATIALLQEGKDAAHAALSAKDAEIERLRERMAENFGKYLDERSNRTAAEAALKEAREGLRRARDFIASGNPLAGIIIEIEAHLSKQDSGKAQP
jgi:hypothetical protein